MEETIKETPEAKQYKEEYLSYVCYLPITCKEIDKMVLAGYKILIYTLLLSIVENCRDMELVNLLYCKQITNTSSIFKTQN